MATTARGRSLTMAQQALGLRSIFPDSEVKLEQHCLRWTGRLQPCDLSRVYTIRIDYQERHYPVIRVLAPALQATQTGFLPHTFDDRTLCLHDIGQWSAAMLIVDTTIPWTAEWLLHYETWLATGEWFGDHDPSTTIPDHYDPLPGL
jgi:hypothetical protein